MVFGNPGSAMLADLADGLSLSKWTSFDSLYDYLLAIIILWAVRLMVTSLALSPNSSYIPDITRTPNNRFSECPLNYPNGWLPVLESSELRANQIKAVFGFGNDLVAFRVRSGRVCVLDAFCPHLGADLAFGGTVHGDSIRCPFHGWLFASDGTCVSGANTSNRSKVQIKVWDSIEVNGFVFVWHHSKDGKPNWFPTPVAQISGKRFTYQGKLEHRANCHIQEVVENGADLGHFSRIHQASELFGSLIGEHNTMLYKYLGNFLKFNWNVKWQMSENEGEQHICKIRLNFSRSILGYTWMRAQALVRQVGPAHMSMRVEVKFMGSTTFHVVQSLVSLGLFEHRYIHHFYAKSSLRNWLFLRYAIVGMRLMVDRDLVVLNNKKFLRTPSLNRSETSLKAFRRWFSQFYQ